MNPSADHDRHDQLLVVAYATNDATGADREHAAALVDSCPECAALAGDVQRIAVATASLPAPRRTRDFRLSAADAARLRPVGWRSIVATFAGPRLAFTRPLAAGLTTLGLAGLLATAVPTAFLGEAATGGAGAAPASVPASPAAEEVAASPAAAPAAAPATEASQGESMAAAPSPVTTPERDAAGYVRAQDERAIATKAAPTDGAAPLATPLAAGDDGQLLATGPTAEEPSPPPLFVLSATFLVVGLGLFALRWTARRVA